MTPTAVGIYYTSELLTEWFFEYEDVHFSEADLIRHYAIEPLYDIVEQYRKGELRPYIARELFRERAAQLQDLYWGYEEITWEGFLTGELPENIYEDEWSWSIFCDDWPALMQVVENLSWGTHVDAHQLAQEILETGQPKRLAIVEWNQGLAYVYKSESIDYRRKLNDAHWAAKNTQPSADADCREPEHDEDQMIPTYVMEAEIDNLLVKERVEYDEPFDPSEMPTYAHPPASVTEKRNIAGSLYV